MNDRVRGKCPTQYRIGNHVKEMAHNQKKVILCKVCADRLIVRAFRLNGKSKILEHLAVKSFSYINVRTK